MMNNNFMIEEEVAKMMHSFLAERNIMLSVAECDFLSKKIINKVKKEIYLCIPHERDFIDDRFSLEHNLIAGGAIISCLSKLRQNLKINNLF